MSRPPAIRVLLVDDSAFMRIALRRIVETEGDLTVVGEAADGVAAITEAARLSPDVVVMDVAMPRLDGLAATRRILEQTDPPAVVMVSAHTRDGSEIAIQALEIGAVDYLWKDSGDGGPDLARLDRELRPLLRHWSQRRREASPPDRARIVPRRARAEPPDLLLVGASTGGPDALATFLAALGPIGVPCIVAQHMPADLGTDFVRHLARRTGLPITLGEHGAAPRPGSITILPGGTDGTLVRRNAGFVLRLEATDAYAHPSVDLLFRSAAMVARNAIGVVLSGMGSDGTAGAAELARRGMPVFAQSPESCVVAGMPRMVLAAGLAAGSADPAGLARKVAALLPDIPG